MTEPDTTAIEKAPERNGSPFVGNETETKTIEHDGQTHTLELRPETRQMRNEALEIAAIAFHEQYDRSGILPSVLEREYAMRRIKSWSLDKPPKIGWPLLPSDLGDKIAAAIGVEQVLQSLRADENPEVEEAKN